MAVQFAPRVFAGIQKLLQTKPVKDVVKKYGRKAYDAYKKANRKIDEKLTPKLPRDKLKEKAVKNKQIKAAKELKKELKKQEQNPLKTRRGKKPFTRTTLGQGQRGQELLEIAKNKGSVPRDFTVDDVLLLAKKQPDKSLKGNPRYGQTVKRLGLVGAGGFALSEFKNALTKKDNETRKSAATKTTPTFKQAFAEADANNQKTFTWKGNRYTTEKAENQRKKFETSGAGVGKSTGLRKKQGGRIKMRGGGKVMLSKSRGAKYI